MTKLFTVDPLNPDPRAIEQCCEILRGGGVVAFPTETVYGLGASARDPKAVNRIYALKGRPKDNPLIVHISKLDHLTLVAAEVPEPLYILARIAWPGPLTVLLKRGPEVVPEVTAGLPTVAVRMPAHPVALSLIECAGPLAAPSANISGKPSPTTGRHALLDMFGRAEAIIDAGESFLGVESTILDLTAWPPRLLRPGAMPLETIEEILSVKVVVPESARGLSEAEVALAPGMKYRHYAPEKPLIVVEAPDTESLVEGALDLLRSLKAEGKRAAVVATRETAHAYAAVAEAVIVAGSRANLYEVAKNLFGALRELDRLNVDVAVFEGLPESGIGLAIMNRVRKAAVKRVVKSSHQLRLEGGAEPRSHEPQK